METPLGRVRGLGSAGRGAHHWWLERLTSVSTLLLLSSGSSSRCCGCPRSITRRVAEWLAAPLAAVPMLLLIVSTFWHSEARPAGRHRGLCA